MVVNSGPGSWTITGWRELWTTMFHVLAYAMAFEQAGKCPECSCTIQVCDYCAHECDVSQGAAKVQIPQGADP